MAEPRKILRVPYLPTSTPGRGADPPIPIPDLPTGTPGRGADPPIPKPIDPPKPEPFRWETPEPFARISDLDSLRGYIFTGDETSRFLIQAVQGDSTNITVSDLNSVMDRAGTIGIDVAIQWDVSGTGES